MELWFQVQDAETKAALAPARELLKDAVADKGTLARPENAKIGRVQPKVGVGGGRATSGTKPPYKAGRGRRR